MGPRWVPSPKRRTATRFPLRDECLNREAEIRKLCQQPLRRLVHGLWAIHSPWLGHAERGGGMLDIVLGDQLIATVKVLLIEDLVEVPSNEAFVLI